MVYKSRNKGYVVESLVGISLIILVFGAGYFFFSRDIGNVEVVIKKDSGDNQIRPIDTEPQKSIDELILSDIGTDEINIQDNKNILSNNELEITNSK